MRNLFLFGTLCLLIGIFAPSPLHLGPVLLNSQTFFWPAGFLIAEGLLFLLYVKVGKFRHRDFMLSLHPWRGDEQVLDVGCGRGLLLAGAAKRIAAVSAPATPPASTSGPTSTWAATPPPPPSTTSTSKASPPAAPSSASLRRTCPSPTPPSTSSSPISASTISTTRPPATKRFARSSASSNPAASPSSPTTSAPANTPTSSATPACIVEKKRGSFLTTFPPLTVVIARKPM